MVGGLGDERRRARWPKNVIDRMREVGCLVLVFRRLEHDRRSMACTRTVPSDSCWCVVSDVDAGKNDSLIDINTMAEQCACVVCFMCLWRYNQDYWFFQTNNFQSMASAVMVFSSRLRDVDDGSNKVAITGITKVKLPFLEAVAYAYQDVRAVGH
jgi:hypothetical protein